MLAFQFIKLQEKALAVCLKTVSNMPREDKLTSNTVEDFTWPIELGLAETAKPIKPESE